jgi:hypothetical protein
MRKALALVLAVTTLAASGSALAQGRDAECRTPTRGNVDRNQEFCFPGENVNPDGAGAGGANSRVPPRIRAGSLIRHRSHFVPEMLRSVEHF